MKIELDNESLLLLKLLLKSSNSLTIEEILNHLNIKRRKFYYILKKVNLELEANKIAPISNVRGIGFSIDQNDKEEIESLLSTIGTDDVILSPSQRQSYMICIFLFPQKRIQIQDFEEKFKVSRNTVFNDLKDVKAILDGYNVDLNVDVKQGYYIESELFTKLSILQYHLYDLLDELPFVILDFINVETVNDYLRKLESINSDLAGIYSEVELRVMSVVFSIIEGNEILVDIPVHEIGEFDGLKERELVTQVFPNVTIELQKYITIILCGNRTPLSINEFQYTDIKLLEISHKLVNNFERISFVNTINKMTLIESVFMHLKLNEMLGKYSIQLINPLIKDISKNYPDIFLFTKLAFEDLRDEVSFPVFDSVIAALTLHFGAHISKAEEDAELITIGIICPTGLSTSRLLGLEVKKILGSNVTIIETSLNDLESIIDEVDYLVSTVNFETHKPLIKVNPILSIHDKAKIQAIANFEDSNYSPSMAMVDELLSVVKSYVDVQTFEKINTEFENRIRHGKYSSLFSKNKNFGLEEILTLDKIQISDEKLDWREAIRKASIPLINNDSIDTHYIDSMIELVETYGPYIMLGDTIALAHSQPVEGKTFLDVSVLVAEEGIYFDNQNSVKILFVLSSHDNEAHMKILKQISKMVRHSKAHLVVKAKSVNQIYKEIINIAKD